MAKGWNSFFSKRDDFSSMYTPWSDCNLIIPIPLEELKNLEPPAQKLAIEKALGLAMQALPIGITILDEAKPYLGLT